MKKFLPMSLMFFMLISAFPYSVHADVAPPETVPGSNVNPGAETTQVRMASETVTLIVSEDPADAHGAVARTEAVFNMVNLGSVEEKMAVRFPLSFFNGNSDGFGRFPEIAGIDVKVNHASVPTRREVQPFLNNETSFQERGEIPWAIFDVTFPPGEDVLIEVAYTVDGFGYFPYEVFKYVLETGAGWNGTIGSADIILRLPYEVNEKNIWVNEVEGYGQPTKGGTFSGNEVRWHFDDLEPNFESNLQFIVLAPSIWENILTETDTVTRNPNDGEAWGRLGKAYKEVIRIKAWLRNDAAGKEMFQLSKQAYERCLALLPNDSLWHYGYADLLWARYYWDFYMVSQNDSEGLLPSLLTHLKTALEIDPNTQLAKDLLEEIYYSVPEALQIEGDTYTYL
ncbi:MAG: hypothetical protein JNK32_09640, partial [Anaerolineales bacterium]|nr:hypothetical protein [Anaerolineales bacterium]